MNKTRIARHDNVNMTAAAEVYIDQEGTKFYIRVENNIDGDETEETISGPYVLRDLELIKEVLTDVIGMKRHFQRV